MIQQFISKLSDNEKKFFYITIFIVCFSFIDRLFFGPAFDRLKKMDENIAQQEATIARDIRFLKHKNKIVEQRNALSKFLSEKQEDDDVVNASFLRVVEQMATNNNVSLVKSNPADINREKTYSEYYANLDCVGKFEDIIKFMHTINSSDQLLKITRFNLTPKKSGADEVVVNASMTIVKLMVTP